MERTKERAGSTNTKSRQKEMESRSKGDGVPAGKQQQAPEKYGEIELRLKGRLVFLRNGRWDGWLYRPIYHSV